MIQAPIPLCSSYCRCLCVLTSGLFTCNVSAKHLQKQHLSRPWPHCRVSGPEPTGFGDQAVLSSSPPAHQPVFSAAPQDLPVTSKKPHNPQRLNSFTHILKHSLEHAENKVLNIPPTFLNVPQKHFEKWKSYLSNMAETRTWEHSKHALSLNCQVHPSCVSQLSFLSMFDHCLLSLN